MAKKKSTTKKKPQTAEQLRKDAIASADANIARIDGKSRATSAAPGRSKAKATTKASPAGKRNTSKRRSDGAKPKPAAKPKRIGCLAAAAQVLAAAGKPMSCKEMMTAITDAKLWSTAGATPEATLYSAIIREIASKGSASRFRKVERGRFEANTTKKGGAA